MNTIDYIPSYYHNLTLVKILAEYQDMVYTEISEYLEHVVRPFAQLDDSDVGLLKTDGSYWDDAEWRDYYLTKYDIVPPAANIDTPSFINMVLLWKQLIDNGDYSVEKFQDFLDAVNELNIDPRLQDPVLGFYVQIVTGDAELGSYLLLLYGQYLRCSWRSPFVDSIIRLFNRLVSGSFSVRRYHPERVTLDDINSQRVPFTTVGLMKGYKVHEVLHLVPEDDE
jgi:hypothetical protein